MWSHLFVFWFAVDHAFACARSQRFLIRVCLDVMGFMVTLATRMLWWQWNKVVNDIYKESCNKLKLKTTSIWLKSNQIICLLSLGARFYEWASKLSSLRSIHEIGYLIFSSSSHEFDVFSRCFVFSSVRIESRFIMRTYHLHCVPMHM